MERILRDPISSLTHLIGGFLSILALIAFIVKQLSSGTLYVSLFVSTIIFAVSMILLYFTSGVYHAINSRYKRTIEFMRKLDHSMIFVLIAGSYSPFCLYVLIGSLGIPLFIALWTIAAVGIGLKIFWMNMPRWLSTGIYIMMGWIAILFIRDIYSAISTPAFMLLVSGGLSYTIGGIIYGIKKPDIGKWTFHDIFHIFIMLGSLCHFLMIFYFIIR